MRTGVGGLPAGGQEQNPWACCLIVMVSVSITFVSGCFPSSCMILACSEPASVNAASSSVSEFPSK